MRGVVVFCLLFLVLPGQEVSAVSTTVRMTGTTTTETQKSETTGTTTTETQKSETTGTTTTETQKSETTGTTTTETQKSETTGSTTTETPKSGTTGSTTPDSNVPGSTTSAAPPTSSDPASCAPGLCGNSATCLQLQGTYECQCPLNYYYEPSNKTCTGGNSFFGEFRIIVEKFESKPESAEYTDLYKRVMNQSNISLFGLDGYLGTVIIQMSLSPSESERSRWSSGEVRARVTHLFLKGTTTSEEDITDKITGNLGSFGAYNSSSICDGFYCDAETTLCVATSDGQGAECTCKNGSYSMPAAPVVTTCRDCSPECYKTEGKYCNLDAKSGAECVCLPGYKSSGDKCHKCEFGYSGAECADNYLLILVIVGAVLGAVVVALLGAVIGVSISSKKGKKSGDRTMLIERDETALAGSSPAPTRLFPKVHAKPDLGEVNKAASFYDSNEEHSRDFPKRDYDENPWYEMARKDRSY